MKVNRFCEHKWAYKNGYMGSVVYGKVIVLGSHSCYVCKHCGKNRMKVSRNSEFKVTSQKEMSEYHKKIGYVRPPVQLEFI